MIPAGAHPRVRKAWFWTGVLYGMLLFFFFGPAFMLGFGIALLVAGPAVWGLLLIGLAVAACLGYLGWLGWYVGALQRSFAFELGDDMLTIQRGVVFRRTSRIPLRRVQDVVVRDGPFLRGAGVGTVHVQTAGMHAGAYAGAAEGLMPGLEHPQAVAQEILEHVKSLRGDV